LPYMLISRKTRRDITFKKLFILKNIDLHPGVRARSTVLKKVMNSSQIK